MSIGCYSDNCSGVVRGQCPGYTQSNCGRYYCSIHSGDGLCGECYKEKSIDKLIEEYSQIAQTIKYDDLPTKIIPPPTGKAKIIDLFIKTIFIGIIFHIFTVAIIISSMNHVYINTFHKNAVYFNMTVGIVSLILEAV